MKRDIKSFTEEICGYAIKLKNNRSDLTQIQKKEYDKKINLELKDKGIQHVISYLGYDDYNPNDLLYSIRFVIPETQIEGTGILYDVKERGAFPLKLYFENCEITYEPRDLRNLTPSNYNELDNSEYINLKKGDEISIKGKIQSCIYNQPKHFTGNRIGWLAIQIIGQSESAVVEKTVKIIQKKNDEIEKQRINADNTNIAASVGVGLLGILAGVGIGLVAGIIFGVIVSIGSCIGGHTSQEQDHYYRTTLFSTIIIGGIIGALIGYFAKRKKK